MACLRFSKIAVVLLALSASLSAQTVVRAGTQGTAWATATLCPNGSFVTATPDNLHVFKAIQAGTGTTGATQPVWITISGLQTTDGTCLWKESGPSGLGGSGSGGGGSPPGGTLNSVQLNNNPNFAGSQAFSFDPNTLELFLQAIGAASAIQNVDSPKFHLRANYWDGAASAVDDWSLQSFTRPNGGGGTTRSFVKMLHSGTSGSSNGSSYTFFFDPLNVGVDCGHEDPLFTSNSVTCFAINGSNTTGSGADLSLRNAAGSGSQRTRFVQSSGGGFVHMMETDPTTTGSAQFGMVGCVPLNCWPYFLFDVSTGFPELYLGGYGFTPTKAAVKFDVDNTGGVTPRRSFVPLVPLDFDPTAVTTYLLSAKELAAPATPAATFEKLYFEATYGACAKDSTGRERCTGGSPTAGSYVLTGSFGACGSPPLGSQSALCFGPSGNIQGSYAGDAFDTFLRASSYSPTGLLCCVGLGQVDLAAFDARYVPINAVSQGVLPEGGASGAGLQNSPCDDGVFASGFVRCNSNFVAGAGIPTDATTVLGLLMKLSAGKMVKIGTSDTNIPVFLCTNSCGSTTANTYPLVAGIGSAVFDGATTAGDYVGASSTTAGDVTDLGASLAAIASNKCVIGQVLTTNGAGGTYSVQVESQCLRSTFYQTVQNNGSSQTQRTKLNLKPGTNVTISVADNSGSDSTDFTINSSGGGGSGSSLLNSQGVLTGVTGNGSSQAIYSYTLPGGTMSTTSCILVTVGWQHTTGSVSTAYTFSFGAATSTSFSGTVTSKSYAQYRICNAGATNSQYFLESPIITGATLVSPISGQPGVDTTVNQTITFNFTVASPDVITPQFFTVESLH